MTSKKNKYPEEENEKLSEDWRVLFLAGILGYGFAKYTPKPFPVFELLGGGMGSMGGSIGCRIGNTVKGIFNEKYKNNLPLNLLLVIFGETHQTDWTISLMSGIGGYLGGTAGNIMGEYFGQKIGYITFPILRTIVGSGVGGIVGGKLGMMMTNLFTSSEEDEDSK